MYPPRDEAVGPVPLELTLNGQCFTSGSPPFYLYNAMVEGLRVWAAPAGAPVAIDIDGVGFPRMTGAPDGDTGLPGAACVFTPLANRTADASGGAAPAGRRRMGGADGAAPRWSTPLTSTSDRHAWCSSASAGVGTYALEVRLNGQHAAPSLLGGLSFSEYALPAVVLSEAEPPGGPRGSPIELRLHGEGFAHHGAGQLRCVLDGARRVAARLLSPRLVACALPADLALGVYQVRLSLNNATDGTLTADSLSYRVYEPPALHAVAPLSGPAAGGEAVVLRGRGLLNLCPQPTAACAAMRARFFRCSFGGVVQPAPPSYLDDTTANCTTTIGAEGAAGLPVRVALNALSFGGGDASDAAGAPPPRYTFVGLHKPALIEAHFSASATALLLRFDGQASNRGGVSGLAKCAEVLDEETVAQLRGGGAGDVQCLWSSEEELQVQLGHATAAAPGMRVGLRPNVLWPRAWALGGAADAPGCCRWACCRSAACRATLRVPRGGSMREMCALADGVAAACAALPPEENFCLDAHGAHETLVDAYYPCDTRATEAREECLTPVIRVRHPEQISSCPSTLVTLDASASTGGGIRPLLFSALNAAGESEGGWRAHPTAPLCTPRSQALLEAWTDLAARAGFFSLPRFAPRRPIARMLSLVVGAAGVPAAQHWQQLVAAREQQQASIDPSAAGPLNTGLAAGVQPFEVHECRDPSPALVDRMIDHAVSTGLSLHGMNVLEPKNIGDMMSTPFLMFPKLRRLQKTRASLLGSHGTDYYPSDMTATTFDVKVRNMTDDDLIVVGGGGLLGIGVDDLIRSVCSSKAQCVFWGVGTNLQDGKGALREYGDDELVQALEGLIDNTRVPLAALRDNVELPAYRRLGGWETSYDATVMLKGLDGCPSEAPRGSRVHYLHKNFKFEVEGSAEEGVPSMTNDEVDLNKVLAFLCSAEAVVTSSYHGALWATLLRRKVVVINPHSSKFRAFQEPAPVILTGTCYDKEGQLVPLAPPPSEDGGADPDAAQARRGGQQQEQQKGDARTAGETAATVWTTEAHKQGEEAAAARREENSRLAAAARKRVALFGCNTKADGSVARVSREELEGAIGRAAVAPASLLVDNRHRNCLFMGKVLGLVEKRAAEKERETLRELATKAEGEGQVGHDAPWGMPKRDN